MKIAVIIPDLLAKSGGARLGLEVAREFIRRGHQATVYTFRYARDYTFAYLTPGLDIITFPKGFSIKERYPFGVAIPGFSTIAAYRNRHRIAKALAALMDGDFDALNPHSSTGYLVAHYFNARRRRVPTVWDLSSLPLLASPAAAGGGIRRPAPLLKRLLAKAIDACDTRFYWRHIDAIAVLDTKTQELVREHFSRTVVVNRTGVDADHFRYRPRQFRGPKRVTLLAHSSFFADRGFEDAIAAVKLLRDWGYDPQLILSGDCQRYRMYRNYRDRLLSLAEQLGVRDRITLPGLVSEDKLLEEYYSADILVHPHRTQTWGMVVCEAMATGLPVIVSRGAGAHEVLTDGVEALLVDANSPPAIAAAVRRLLENPDLYVALSRNGAAFVRREITWTRHVEKILQLMAASRVSPGSSRPL